MLSHRTDDQPCACDSCMEYMAEDEGVAWFKLTPAKQAELRPQVRDSRLADQTIEDVIAAELVYVIRMESEGRVLALSVEDRARRWAIGIARKVGALIEEAAR